MGNILIGVALAVVALVLCAGLFTLWKGGETSRTWSNKLMRLRVVAQAVAILIIVLVFWLGRHSGS